MAYQLSSLAASMGVCLVSFLAITFLAITLYILGVVASFAVFCIREFAQRAQDRPPLIGTVLRQLKNFDKLFDEQVSYALLHPTSRLVYPGHSEIFTSDPVVIEHFLKTNFSKYSKDLLMRTTMDSMFKVGLGFELNTLSGSDESSIRFSKAFDEASSLVYYRYVDMFWQVKRQLNIGSEAKLKKNIQIIDDFVMQLIHQKREQMRNRHDQKAREDILSRFILASEEDPVTMNDRYLRDIVLSFLIAGKDTTANTLSWFIYMLCRNPIVQDKVAYEIKESVELVQEDNMETFTARLKQGAIDKMQYLHATLTETLRLYPAVPVDGKMADEDDLLPNGYKVIKGDGMNYMIYAMGRMKYLWGEDAEEFRPERWLVDGIFQQESPYKFISFNAGPRICLGKEFAYRQMKIMAATLIHFFRFKLEDESKSPVYKTMFTLHMDQGLHLFVYPRKISA